MQRFIAILGLGWGVLSAGFGCATSDESAQEETSTPAGLRGLSDAERKALGEVSGVTIVGALPTIVVDRSTDAGEKSVQDVTVGGPNATKLNFITSVYFTGFSGRAGAFIDAIHFDDPLWRSGTYGGQGGTPFASNTCTGIVSGRIDVMTGIYGRAGAYIDQLGPICSELISQNAQSGVGGVFSGSTTRSSYALARSTLMPGPNVGGHGGTQFAYYCPYPDWIVGWGVGSGQYVEQLTAYCGH